MTRLGIDLGGTKIEGVLISPDGKIISRFRVPTPTGDYAATLDAVDRLIRELTDDPDMPIGIGTPGSISRISPLMRNANSTCLNDKPLLEDLENKLARPVRIANDADCFTLSEASDGAAAGSSVVFGVILGTGVGGGICINGNLLSGVNGIAGEWGHIPLPDSPGQDRSCFCGRVNCVETWLSGPGLARTYELMSGSKKSAEEIADLASKGNMTATNTLDEYCSRLAGALAIVVNIVDPDTIVLGGGLSNIDLLYDLLPVRLAPHVFSDHVETRIVKARHGDSSGVRGAAWLF
ncbi:MAG: ROK family protein [Gammaproteobacteria bacterium]|jgi:fructokinase|nr:ROK family protein [Gammaproteobacteria bacterium]MBT4491854.1 ROK family protein [Gammaproteobacteria bacterium]MBT7370307.1 ROK family protein [Gammaproteobacteria bacterium]